MKYLRLFYLMSLLTPLVWGCTPSSSTPQQLTVTINIPTSDAQQAPATVDPVNAVILEYWVLYSKRFPKPRHKGKKAAIVVASLAPFPFNQLSSQSRGAIRAVKTVLHAAGFDIRKQINVPVTPDPAHIGNRWLSEARRLGRSMGAW